MSLRSADDVAGWGHPQGHDPEAFRVGISASRCTFDAAHLVDASLQCRAPISMHLHTAGIRGLRAATAGSGLEIAEPSRRTVTASVSWSMTTSSVGTRARAVHTTRLSGPLLPYMR
jgi:hypothetical protein